MEIHLIVYLHNFQIQFLIWYGLVAGSGELAAFVQCFGEGPKLRISHCLVSSSSVAKAEDSETTQHNRDGHHDDAGRRLLTRDDRWIRVVQHWGIRFEDIFRVRRERLGRD
jgi:hypothetical protein